MAFLILCAKSLVIVDFLVLNEMSILVPHGNTLQNVLSLLGDEADEFSCNIYFKHFILNCFIVLFI